MESLGNGGTNVCYRARDEAEGFAVEDRKESKECLPDSHTSVARSSPVENASMYWWLTQKNGNALQWEAEQVHRKEER